MKYLIIQIYGNPVRTRNDSSVLEDTYFLSQNAKELSVSL